MSSSAPGPGAGVHVALTDRAHDRIGHRRNDHAWLARAWDDPDSRVLVLAGSRLRTERAEDGDHLVWVAPQQAPPGVPVLLGERDGVVHLALLAEQELAADDSWVGLREVVQGLVAQDAPLAVHAVGLAEWHRTHRFCPRCTGTLVSEQAGHVLRCADCGRQQFPRSDPAVIMVVAHGRYPHDRCLLGRKADWPDGRYSTLAGFVEPGESMEDAVRREVHEESGVRVGAVEYVANQPWPFPASLMVGFLAHADSTDVAVDGEEIEHARWFSREELRAEAEAGTLLLPGGVSISRSLVEHWYGGSLPGRW